MEARSQGKKRKSQRQIEVMDDHPRMATRKYILLSCVTNLKINKFFLKKKERKKKNGNREGQESGNQKKQQDKDFYYKIIPYQQTYIKL